MRSISSVARTMTGIINSTSASDTAKPERSKPSVATHSA
jgi:hypothetical protein